MERAEFTLFEDFIALISCCSICQMLVNDFSEVEWNSKGMYLKEN